MKRLLPLLALTACVDVQNDCERMREDLSRCLGSRLSRLDCSTVADADVRRLRSLTQGTSCELLANALPLDGDLTSTTCRALGVGCVEARSVPALRQPTRYPVLLVNGIDTSPLFRYSERIVASLEQQTGVDVTLATLTPWESPLRRAPELLKYVQHTLQRTGAGKVNLICHSLGGLDCRYLVSPNGLGADLGVEGLDELVASITTIGTAHRGTRAADVLLGLVPDDGTRAQTINDFASLAGDWFSATQLEHDVHLRDALQALTTTSAPAFNAQVTDAPDVFYQSFAGVSHPLGESNAALDEREARLCLADLESLATRSSGAHDAMALVLVPFNDVVGLRGNENLPHDGFVTVDSARWGVFRGCIPADHMEQLGQKSLPDVNVSTGVDVARFYSAIAADLAERGF